MLEYAVKLYEKVFKERLYKVVDIADCQSCFLEFVFLYLRDLVKKLDIKIRIRKRFSIRYQEKLFVCFKTKSWPKILAKFGFITV